MLKYLVQVTEDLLIVAVLTGFVFALSTRLNSSKGSPVVKAGLVCGWLAAALLAYLKNTTKLVDSGLWNLRFVGCYLIGVLLAAVMCIPPLRSCARRVGAYVQQTGLALMLVGAIGYMAPESLGYPWAISLAVSTVMSTEFFFRMLGWVLGLALMALLSFATYRVTDALSDRVCYAMGTTSVILCGVELLGLGLRAMLTRRIIPQNHTVFQIAVFASNGILLFSCLMMALVLMCVAMLVTQSLRQREPYDNPAQHRKIRAKWRRRRRWSAVAAVCVALSLANMTAIKALDAREVELSPSEDCEVRDDGVYVSLEQVDDGHLHRFTYTTDSGVGIRFIVIKKPGGSSYGIGLDACDICGETGYYEREGQVVCKLCDVVMNVQTIGFKGGCNPIVIDYEIRDGYIHIPFDTLLEHEVIFTR